MQNNAQIVSSSNTVSSQRRSVGRNCVNPDTYVIVHEKPDKG